MASNKDQIKTNLRKKHNQVFWVKEIDHLEYLKIVAALASGPGGISGYLNLLQGEIVKNVGSIATETIFKMLKGDQDSTLVSGQPVYVNIATYNHWTKEKYPKIDRWKFSWGEIKVPRPNTHELYVAVGNKQIIDAVKPDIAVSEILGQGGWNGPIAVSNGYIYLADSEGKLRRGKISNNTGTEVIGQGGWYGWIAVDPQHIYLANGLLNRGQI